MPERKFEVSINLNKQALTMFKAHPLSTMDRAIISSGLVSDDEGMVVYDTDLDALYYWTGTTWVTDITGGANPVGPAGGDLSGDYPDPGVAQFDGQLPAYYLDRTNHTGTQDYTTITGLSTVAHTGAYSDLTGNPTNVSAFTNDANYLTVTSGDARYPQLTGSYTNPSWLVSIPFSKLTSTPTTLSGYGITDAYTKTQSDANYFPLLGGFVTGIAGAGYVGLPTQSVVPSTPSSGTKLYASTVGSFSWVGASGFSKTFSGSGLTASRIYTLPDATGTLALTTDIFTTLTTAGISYIKDPTWDNTKTLYYNIMNGGAHFVGHNRNLMGLVDIPADFAYFTPTVRRGNVLGYKTSVDDLEDWRAAFMNIAASKLTYYVSESGSDANSGLTPALPLRSISTALAKTNMLNVVVLGGVYGNNQTPDGTHIGNYNLICSPNAHIGNFFPFTGWAVDGTYSNLYTITNATVSQITAVYDRTIIRNDGSFGQYYLAASASDCSQRYGSYYITGTTLYVNTSVAPSNDYNTVLFCLGGRMALSAGSSSYKVYVEGGVWYGTLQLRSLGSAGVCPQSYLRDLLIVKSSGVFNAIWNEGYSQGSYNVIINQMGTKDGFNYHIYLSSDPSYNFEINCKVINMKGASSSDQASTQHDLCRCVTINPEYTTSGDQVIHDIGGAKRIVLGGRLQGLQGNCVIRTSDTNTVMWVENCELAGNADFDVYLGTSGTMYLRGTVFSRTTLSTLPFTIDVW